MPCRVQNVQWNCLQCTNKAYWEWQEKMKHAQSFTTSLHLLRTCIKNKIILHNNMLLIFNVFCIIYCIVIMKRFGIHSSKIYLFRFTEVYLNLLKYVWNVAIITWIGVSISYTSSLNSRTSIVVLLASHLEASTREILDNPWHFFSDKSVRIERSGA